MYWFSTEFDSQLGTGDKFSSWFQTSDQMWVWSQTCSSVSHWSKHCWSTVTCFCKLLIRIHVLAGDQSHLSLDTGEQLSFRYKSCCSNVTLLWALFIRIDFALAIDDQSSIGSSHCWSEVKMADTVGQILFWPLLYTGIQKSLCLAKDYASSLWSGGCWSVVTLF